MLCALLLAVELDRYVVRDVLNAPWSRPSSTWFRPPLGVSPFIDALVATRANLLLIDLVDADIARMSMNVEQQLTPSLQELAAVGARAYAERHIPDPRLTTEELAALDAAEAQLAAGAQTL